MSVFAGSRYPKSIPAAAFITALHNTGWHSTKCFRSSGHIFESLSKGTKTIMVQIYPKSEDFQVWRPITESTTIAETAAAIAIYGGGA